MNDAKAKTKSDRVPAFKELSTALESIQNFALIIETVLLWRERQIIAIKLQC